MRPPLRHRATVERNTAAGRDRMNHPLEAFTVHLEALPVDWWVTAERSVHGPDVQAVIEDARVLVALDADVTVDDEITEVRKRDGSVISSSRYRIDADMRMEPSHRELVLVASERAGQQAEGS